MPMSEEARKAASERMKAMHADKKVKVLPNLPDDPPAEPKIISQAASDAGMMPPASNLAAKIGLPGHVIRQLPASVLEKELDEMTLKEFVKLHTDAQDANVLAMSQVTRLSESEIREVQRELGYQLPDGV